MQKGPLWPYTVQWPVAARGASITGYAPAVYSPSDQSSSSGSSGTTASFASVTSQLLPGGPPPFSSLSTPPHVRFTDFYTPADVLHGPPRFSSLSALPTRTQARVLSADFYRLPADASVTHPPIASPLDRMVRSAPMRVYDQLTYSPPAQMPRQRPGSAPMQMCELGSPPGQVPLRAPSSTQAPTLASPPGSALIQRSIDPLPTLPVDNPGPVPQRSWSLKSIFSRNKGKKPVRGSSDVGTDSEWSRHGRSWFQAAATMTRDDLQIRFNHTGEYAGFVNHSPHRVMYKNKVYPTALHLLEALKFTHQPALQERIRKCKNVNDMYPLSASFREHVRLDWGQVFLKAMEDVLYLKFKQHPPLRALLLGTGDADIIYADENPYWGEGRFGDGVNELGRALVAVRERLQDEI